MNNSKPNVRMIFDYEERKSSLLADGYVQRFESILNDGVLCKLVHSSNGNYIIISARGGKLVQRTNGKVTHSQEY